MNPIIVDQIDFSVLLFYENSFVDIGFNKAQLIVKTIIIEEAIETTAVSINVCVRIQLQVHILLSLARSVLYRRIA